MYIYDTNGRVPAQGTLLFLGDSITDSGNFITFINTYFRLFFPDLKLNLVNLGVSSETCSGLSEQDHPFPRPSIHDRIDRVLREVKPNFTVISYGINDMIYHPYTEDRMAAFMRGMTMLVEKLHSVNSKVFVCTPCVFDPVSFDGALITSDQADNYSYRMPYAQYNTVMEQLAIWERTELAGQVEGIVDWHQTTGAMLAQIRRSNPDFISGDGIHPGLVLSATMAQTLLSQLFNLTIPRFWELLQSDGMRLYWLIASRDQLTHSYIKEKVGHTNPDKAELISADELRSKLMEKDDEIDSYIATHPELFAGFTDKY